jgi:hypothetical protein
MPRDNLRNFLLPKILQYVNKNKTIWRRIKEEKPCRGKLPKYIAIRLKAIEIYKVMTACL